MSKMLIWLIMKLSPYNLSPITDYNKKNDHS